MSVIFKRRDFDRALQILTASWANMPDEEAVKMAVEAGLVQGELVAYAVGYIARAMLISQRIATDGQLQAALRYFAMHAATTLPPE